MKRLRLNLGIVCLMLCLFSCKQSNKVDTWESASEAVYNMHVGWNLGNTLDVHGDRLNGKSIEEFQTAWGQPLTTQAMIDKFKEAGFGAIRVPVTWNQHMNEDDIVDEVWMNRVQEVIDYVINRGMYCIVNVHHDTGAADDVWIQASPTVHSQVQARYKKLWTQIATRFKDYDHRLIFEAHNEMLDTLDTWDAPKEAGACEAVNMFAQDFVDVVRSTGGNNKYRNLSINTYAAAHSPQALDGFKLPQDVVENHLFVQVHDYSPFNFALNKKSPDKIFTEEGAQQIAHIMATLNERFCSKGIPVIIGEFAAMDKNNTPERVKHATCVLTEASKYGIVCFQWMALLDRKTLTWSEPEIKDAIINNAKPIKLTK